MLIIVYKAICDRCEAVTENNITEAVESNIGYAASMLTIIPDEWSIYRNKQLCKDCTRELTNVLNYVG